jgi:uncharacterized RDD family membrane protein YckC
MRESVRPDDQGFTGPLAGPPYGGRQPSGPAEGGWSYGHQTLPRPAGRWRRLFAGVFDGFLLGTVTTPLTTRAGVTDMFDRANGDFADHVFALKWNWLIAMAVVWFLYYWVLTAFWNGQTVGKKVFDIRVVLDDGAPVTPAAAASRALLSGLFVVAGLDVLDIVCILFSRRKRALHDMAAGTLVVPS